MQRIVSRLNDILSAVTGWLMMIMTGLLVADVFWRTFAQPLLGMAELSVFVMMIVIYLGLSRCEEYDQHVRLEFLVEMTRGRAKKALILTARLLAAVTVAFLFYAVTTDAWSAWLTNDSLEGMVSLPIWPTKFVMVLGAALFLAQTVLKLFQPLLPPADAVWPDVAAEGYE